MDSQYQVPKALTVIAGIFLVAGALFLLVPIIDILNRRGWKSMMWIMIPVWPINASYLGPLTLYLYFKYGRPTKPEKRKHQHPDSTKKPVHGSDDSKENHDLEMGAGSHAAHNMGSMHDSDTMTEVHDSGNQCNMHNMHAMHSHSPGRPTWATVLIGVFHCGSGCVLGDLVGEWLVYGTGASINGAGIWASLLIDYAFALLFGIIFQYFSIAPMSGDYGLKSLVRAIKADFLSLTSFEVGLFGWMVAFQVGIWDYQLETNTWLYWWMMQVGMAIGSMTAFPVNWWLITRNIKEPCA
ncbi:hypothetical protein MMC26_006116 [Xylographa opegraphella]|nr:hypothetical protein [Xylographa opegraphella]